MVIAALELTSLFLFLAFSNTFFFVVFALSIFLSFLNAPMVSIKFWFKLILHARLFSFFNPSKNSESFLVIFYFQTAAAPEACRPSCCVCALAWPISVQGGWTLLLIIVIVRVATVFYECPYQLDEVMGGCNGGGGAGESGINDRVVVVAR